MTFEPRSLAAAPARPTLASLAPGCVRDGGLGAATVAELDRHGFSRIFVPRSFGGSEVDLSDYVQSLVALAEVDASTAWVLNIFTVSNWLVAGLFGDEALLPVWGPGRRGLVTGSMVAGGPCVTERDGGDLLVSGTWSFVSGCEHADWIFLKIPAPASDPEPPAPHLVALVPKSAFDLLDDWRYLGLEGTGSRSVTLERTRVPEGLAAWFSDTVLERGVPASRGRQLAHTRLPSRVVMRLPITAVAFGVARRALALYDENVREIRPNGFEPRTVDSFRQRYAVASLELRQAELLLRDVVDEVTHRLAAGRDFPVLVRATAARDLVQVVHLCVAAVDRLMAVSGARQMFDDRPMQAAFRDVHAVAGHFSCDLDRAMTNWGRLAFDLDVGDEVI